MPAKCVIGWGFGLGEYDSAEECFRIRQEFSEIDNLVEDFKNRYSGGYQEGKFGHYRLVGYKPKATKDSCGKFHVLKGCPRVELHNKTIFDSYGNLVDCAGLVAVHPVFYSCGRPDCPVCFLRYYAVREARKITLRLKESSKKYGRAEHIVVSLSKSDYGLTFEQLRAKVYRVLKVRGIIGGCHIFHPFRYANFKESVRKKVPFGWYFSVHYHLLAYLDDSYDKCRGCRFQFARGSRYCCKDCSGFYGRSRRAYLNDKAIVEVLPERKSVFKTAFYQLSHAGMRDDTARAQVVTWFGVCSYRKLKVVIPVEEKLACPICGKPVMDLRYSGDFVIIVNRNHPEFKAWRFMKAVENGVEVFSECSSG